MDKTKRQKRILQKRRNLKKWTKREKQRKKLWAFGDIKGNFELDESDEKRARINANHGKRCSCPVCGNPRRFNRKELTIQEKRAQENYARDNDYFDGF